MHHFIGYSLNLHVKVFPVVACYAYTAENPSCSESRNVILSETSRVFYPATASHNNTPFLRMRRNFGRKLKNCLKVFRITLGFIVMQMRNVK